MKILLVLLLTLTGCTTVPVARSFPEAPANLLNKCDTLEQSNYGQPLSAIIGVVVDNYSKYHDCESKQAGWITWYTQQKSIFETVK